MGVQKSTNRITISILLLLLLSAYFITQTQISYGQDSTSTNTDEISVTLNVSGDTSVCEASLDRNTYHAGDTVYLNWRGSAVSNDFYIPTAITYGSKKIQVSDIIKTDLIQSANSEYERRMNSAGTMTDYDSLKSYIVKDHSISLGQITLPTTVNISFERVTPVYRMYNMITSEHLFTTNRAEYEQFVTLGQSDKDAWIGEGVSWLAPYNGSKTVHRLYNSALGRMGSSSHYYTADESEISWLMTQGWSDDGEANQFKSGGSVAIYTCYNESLGSAHHYTSSKSEWEGLSSHGWDLERDKNGSSGAFSGVMATSWSYSKSYYVVEHMIDKNVVDKQFVSGAAGEMTSAKSLSYTGYSAASTSVASISSDNSSVVQISYEKKTYQVTFDGNGQSLSVAGQRVDYGGKISDPGTQNSAGYVFEGWCYDKAGTHSVNFEEDTMPAGPLTLYASWSQDKQVRYVVLHRYQKTDGLYPELDENGKPEEGIEYEYKYGTIGTTTSEVPRETAGFDRATVFQRTLVENTSTLNPDTGWPDLNPDTQLPDNWVDIRYERNKHTLTFDLNGHGDFGDIEADKGYVVMNGRASVELMQGQEIESLTPVDSTLHFAGWYREATCENHWGHGEQGARSMPDSDLTLYACWTEGELLTITYETNGADDASAFYSYEFISGNIPQRPDPDPTRVGYDFKGWYFDSSLTNEYKFDTTLSDSVTLYAKWEPKSGTAYQVIHKRQNEDGTYTSALSESETWTGTTGMMTDGIATKSYEGFHPVYPIENKIIAGDGSTVVEILYARNVHTITYSLGGYGTNPPQVQAMYGVIVEKPSSVPVIDGFSFAGWYKDEDCTIACNFGYERVPDEDLVLYAKWNLTADLWIAPASRITTGNSTEEANVVNPEYKGAEIGIVKLESEIIDDASTLASGSKTPGYQQVYDQYVSYMNNDNYHLYVKWNGSLKDSSGVEQSENAYVEFRIISVGQHDQDGTGLTFQAIHCLPSAYVMNDNTSNSWGFEQSKLSSRLLWYGMTTTSEVYMAGDISTNFDQGFLSAIKTVNKYTSAGGMSQSYRYADYKFWLLSYKEITGAKGNFVAGEGFQYPYFENLKISPSVENAALCVKTRAQNAPENLSQTKNTWWLRSPYMLDSKSFMVVGGLGSGEGNPSNSAYSNSKLGVVLSFCL